MNVATEDHVDRAGIDAFVRPRRKLLLVTTRDDGRPQVSPVVGALHDDGHLLISSYPTRAKVANLRKRPDCAVVSLSDDFDGPWVQLYGEARVVDGEDGVSRRRSPRIDVCFSDVCSSLASSLTAIADCASDAAVAARTASATAAAAALRGASGAPPSPPASRSALNSAR